MEGLKLIFEATDGRLMGEARRKTLNELVDFSLDIEHDHHVG